ncbi:MAG: hypothetical protein MAG451_02348 [Anaerolineales bacterium]|nr:hypothetical protein [Anaerolineales bacterium]
MFSINQHRTMLFGVILLFALVVGCSGGEQAVTIELAPASLLPPGVQTAEPKVREAYQFAIANQEYLANFPCHCGCGAMDHESNLDCYIDEIKPDGTIAFDNHAFQ